MTVMSSTFTAFHDDSEFLDALPLKLGDDEAMDDFDLCLDDQNVEQLLAQSNGSSVMDFQFDSMCASMGSINFESNNFHTVDEELQQDDAAQPTRHYHESRVRIGRRRSPSPPRKRLHISSTVDFDPLPYDHHSTSHDEVSMCSYSTAQTALEIHHLCMQEQEQQQLRCTSELSCDTSCFPPSPVTQAQYNEALEKLARSMKRTEESRRLVIIARELQLKAAENERMLMRQQNLSDLSKCGVVRSLSPGRSSVMAAFFSGSRETLTSGLEQSRMQLRMYMNQVNNQTL